MVDLSLTRFVKRTKTSTLSFLLLLLFCLFMFSVCVCVCVWVGRWVGMLMWMWRWMCEVWVCVLFWGVGVCFVLIYLFSTASNLLPFIYYCNFYLIVRRRSDWLQKTQTIFSDRKKNDLGNDCQFHDKFSSFKFPFAFVTLKVH